MPLVKCPHCQFEVFSKITVCPRCNGGLSPFPRPKMVKKTVWEPAAKDIENEILRPTSDPYIKVVSYSFRTDEDRYSGEAGYYVFILELDHWGRTEPMTKIYKQRLLDKVASVERKCAEWNRKIGFNFSIEYFFVDK